MKGTTSGVIPHTSWGKWQKGLEIEIEFLT